MVGTSCSTGVWFTLSDLTCSSFAVAVRVRMIRRGTPMIRNKLIALALCAGLATLIFSINAQDAAKPVTPDDVLTMMSVGLSDSIILAKIHQHNKPIDLSTDDLVRLKKAKVSDAV